MANLLTLLFIEILSTYSFATAWTLVDTYNASTWESSMWLETRFTNSEYVNYLNKDAALAEGLIRTQNGQLYLGVDSSKGIDWASGIGRDSVRLRTNKKYNAGTLVIGDFAHIPPNTCGIWPSFWMVGPNWPQDGEIDIMEGVNQMTQNQITIHTNPGCVPSQTGTGTTTANADCGAGGGAVGCGVLDNNNGNWGSAFNSAGGGVYAMQWTADGIRVWSWTSANTPQDVKVSAPDPRNWGSPVANWQGCDFSQVMDNMAIVINTAFCGNWAGAVWKSGSCASLATECYEYVASNPQVYSDAYWLVNSIKVYQ